MAFFQPLKKGVEGLIFQPLGAGQSKRSCGLRRIVDQRAYSIGLLLCGSNVVV